MILLQSVLLKLIYPSRNKYGEKSSRGTDFIGKILGLHPPMSLALPTIAALTPEDVKIEIIDENIEDINFDQKVDLVGIGAMSHLIPRAYEIADEFRKRGTKVVIGGIHASMLPEEALEHADSVVIGEAEYVWKKIIEDLKNGDLQKLYESDCLPNLENSPIPRYDLLKNHKYLYNVIQTARGCPFNCKFCSVTVFSGREMRCKSIEQVIKEIKSLPQHFIIKILGHEFKIEKPIFFADDNFIGNKKYAKDLMRALLPLKLSWQTQASINVAKDKEMLALMQKAGCTCLFIGFESLSANSLKEMGKGVNKLEEYKNNIDTIHSYGIQVMASFVFGNDHDDKSIFEKTVNFINDNNIIYLGLNILTPLPGTKLYSQMEQERRILHKNWKRYDFNSACFRPKQMSAKTLEEGFHWLIQQIYSVESISKRLKNFGKKFMRQGVQSEKFFSKMSLKGKLFFGILALKVFIFANGKRRFILDLLKGLSAGEIKGYDCLYALSCNDFANNFTIRHDLPQKQN